MSEFVCISPDGYLEVWTLVTSNIEVFGSFLFWTIEYYAPNDTDFKYKALVSRLEPRFWGREVLGEL